MPGNETTTVLLLADTHGRLHPHIARLAGQADHVLHAGDIGDPAILDLLAAGGAAVTAVLGNNDTPGRWPEAARQRLTGIAATAHLDLPGGLVAVEHGHKAMPAARRHALLRARHPSARLVVYGHSHHQVIDDDGPLWVVNPGAAGRSRTFGGSGCIVLSASPRRWTLSAYRFPLSDWNT